MYNRFIEILKLSARGLNGEEVGRALQINNVRKYLTGEKKSFLTHLRAEHDRLGPPRFAHQWLPVHLKPRGTPDTFWIEVPSSQPTFESIRSFIQRTGPETIDSQRLADFGFRTSEELKSQRTNLFGFLLGATVGDAGKRPKGTTKFFSRSLSLELSKNKPNSYRFGEFVTLCANATLNLGMHRISNSKVSDKRYGKTECYQWISSSSPLISWIVNECLGLENHENTTYDSLRMDWVLGAPQDFQVHFLQGIAESDGWPDAGQDRAKMVSSPNTKLFKTLLESLGCNPLKLEQPPVQLLQISTEEANRLPLFNPRVASNLFHETRTLALAKRHTERTRLPQETIQVIRELSETISNANEICLRLAERTGYKVSSNTVRKYAQR